VLTLFENYILLNLYFFITLLSCIFFIVFFYFIYLVQPKSIAFVHGSIKKTKNLATRLSSSNIYFTAPNQTIEMKSDTKTYSIKMDVSFVFYSQ